MGVFELIILLVIGAVILVPIVIAIAVVTIVFRKNNKTLFKVLAGVILSLVLIGVVIFLLSYIFIWPPSFNRELYSGVVEQVRQSGIAPGQKMTFKMDDLSNPKSLRVRNPDEYIARGQGAGCVEAEMTYDGNLKVVIETRDWGHAGEDGFAYSDVPLDTVPYGPGDESGWFYLDVPSHLNLVLLRWKIDENWWRVCYNLD